MKTAIFPSLPKEYNSDIQRMIEGLLKRIVFSTKEEQDRYKKVLYEQFKQNPAVYAFWHSYAVGVLSFEPKNDTGYICVNAILVEDGFKGNGFIEAMEQTLRQNYNDSRLEFNCVDIGDEYHVPVLEE